MRTLLQILVWSSGLLALLLLVLYAVAFDVWRVPADDPFLSASIRPTLAPGDLLVISRHDGDVARGRLMRCPDPQAAGRFVVARAIGAPGDKLVVAGEVVTIDGHRAPSPHACDEPRMTVFDPNSNEDLELDCGVEETGEMTYSALRSAEHVEPPTQATVEPGKWFLVSDDRHVHLDSRDYGQIDVSGCQHVLFRVVGAKGWSDWRTRLTLIW